MSMFNPEEVMNTTTNEALDTSQPPVPVNDYQAVAENVEIKPSRAGDKLVMHLRWELMGTGDDAIDGRKITQYIVLDTTENGALDMGRGKNTGLGQLRTALKQNQPGKPWSPSMIAGNVAIVHVEEDEYEGRPTNRINKVAAAS